MTRSSQVDSEEVASGASWNLRANVRSHTAGLTSNHTAGLTSNERRQEGVSRHSGVSVNIVTLLRELAFFPTRPTYSADCGCSIPPCGMLQNLRLVPLHLCPSKFSGKEPWLDWILQVLICGLRSEIRLTTRFPGAQEGAGKKTQVGIL